MSARMKRGSYVDGGNKQRDNDIDDSKGVLKHSKSNQKTRNKKTKSKKSEARHNRTPEDPWISVSRETESFGEPIRCGKNDESGLGFGGDGLKETPATNAASNIKEEHDIAKGLWEKLCKDSEKRKQASRGMTVYDFVSDDECDENDDHGTATRGATGISQPNDCTRNGQHPRKNKIDHHDEKSNTTSDRSKQEVDSADKLANEGKGKENMKDDGAKAEEKLRKQGKSKEKCNFCGKISYSMKTCSRCQLNKYCDRDCQIQDFQDHKKFCKRTQRAKKALDQLGLGGNINVELSLESGLIDETCDIFEGLQQPLSPVIAEIVGPYPGHPFRPGVTIRDIYGFETFIMFYSTQTVYTDLSLALPIPLQACLIPGNYVVLLSPFLHYFLDGTEGIRIDDLDNEVKFVFSKQSSRR